MCGIAGLFSKDVNGNAIINNMIDTIKHRGPDNKSVISLESNTIWLGHTRLSIIDLNESSNQPMSYLNDRYWITFNGEIYNYIELKDELIKEGYSFRTNSDTEVILASYAHWGEDCLNHFNGMFAFIIVDTIKKAFFCARDRYAVKPLYYTKSSRILAFGSEIKEFTVLPEWNPTVNGQRAYDYLKFGLTDHTNETLFNNVYQIRGGEYAKGSTINPIESLSVMRWYNPSIKQIKISREDAVFRFKELFFDSVKLRLRSDVTVGSCLSGGLDSSSIVCVVNDLLGEKQLKDSQRTVSALAKGTPHDESKYIDIVLQERKINGYFVNPSPENLWKIQNKLIWQQDEPFGSTSIYAKWCVFEKARKENLTVMLDGQGADELLAGYLRFFSPFYSQLFNGFHWGTLRKELNYASQYHNHSIKTIVKSIMKTNMPSWLISLISRTFSETNEFEWYSIDKLDATSKYPNYYGNNRAKTVSQLSEQLLFYNNLPMLLRYEDRNSMAHSVESRLPFLDYRLVEFVQSLPDDFKIHNGETKSILREAMKDVLPEQIRMRMDKIGFETPEEKWEKEHSSEFREMIKNSIDKTNGIITEKALNYFDNVVAGSKLDFTVWRMINFGKWYDIFINQNNQLLME